MTKEERYEAALELIANGFPDNVGGDSDTIRRNIAQAALAGKYVYVDNGDFMFEPVPAATPLSTHRGTNYDGS